MVAERRTRWLTWCRRGPHLYVITDAAYAGRSHVAIVEEAIEGGAELIQMRHKMLSDKAFYEQAVQCARLCREADVWFVINDRVHIALAVEADGIHVGQDDLPPSVIRQIVRHDMLIGRSTHSPQEFQRAQAEPVDYVAFGPLFATRTKPDTQPLGVALLREVMKFATKPVVGIGGITLERLPAVVPTGVTAVAVVSDIMTGRIRDRVAAYRKVLQELASGPLGIRG